MITKFEDFLLEKKENKLTVYHGINSKFLDNIKKEGIISKNGYNQGWYMVSTDFESALFHSTPEDKEDAYVIELEIPIKPNDHWIGYPYLWKGMERNDKSTWFALMKKLPKSFIKKIHKVKYNDYFEQKMKGF